MEELSKKEKSKRAKEKSIIQIAKMITSGEISQRVYDKYLSNCSVGSMDTKSIISYLKDEKMVAMYDLEDNLLYVFRNYQECADYFNTKKEYIETHLSLMRSGLVAKKRDFKNKRWVKLYIIEE